jgi:capsule polysaccharide export protein KpsE/RkpR
LSHEYTYNKDLIDYLDNNLYAANRDTAILLSKLKSKHLLKLETRLKQLRALNKDKSNSIDRLKGNIKTLKMKIRDLKQI